MCCYVTMFNYVPYVNLLLTMCCYVTMFNYVSYINLQ